MFQIGCDNEDCEHGEWFHYHCVGLEIVVSLGADEYPLGEGGLHVHGVRCTTVPGKCRHRESTAVGVLFSACGDVARGGDDVGVTVWHGI